MRGGRGCIQDKPPKRGTAQSGEPEWLSFAAEFEFAITYLELRPLEFWELTPAEFYEMAEGYNKRDIKRTNELIFLAWNTAALSRVKEMPELKDLYIKSEPKRPQTDEEMFTVVQMLNAAYGGEVVEV